MGKLPAYLHYAKDWLTDVNLSRCSKAAKGVWQDVLDVMFLNSVRGVACNEDGSPWTDTELSRAIGGDLIENENCIRELLAKGVARRNANGAIFSRRMVADENDRQANARRVRKHRVTANETVDVMPSVMPDVMPLSGNANANGTEKTFKKISETYIAEVYKHYPRKEGRGAAFKAIGAALERLLKGQDSPGDLFHSMDDAVIFLAQRVKLFASTPAGQAGEYTPHPATWFNQKRYLDDEAEWYRRGREQSADEWAANYEKAKAARAQ